MTAPALHVSQWFNTPQEITLASLRGRVVLIEAFQMLCPGCVAHGLPLAKKAFQTFPPEDLAVLGLHTVFEHHAAMTPVSLQAFLLEYDVCFPVGVDAPGAGALPQTMEAFGMRGTPSLLLFDRNGALQAHHFGKVAEMSLGAEIARLIAAAPARASRSDTAPAAPACDDTGCEVPGYP